MALAYDLGYLPADIYQQLTLQAESVGKQLNTYIAYLKRSKQGAKDPPPGYTIHEEPEPYLLENLNDASLTHQP
jgi:hypothetical protein